MVSSRSSSGLTVNASNNVSAGTSRRAAVSESDVQSRADEDATSARSGQSFHVDNEGNEGCANGGSTGASEWSQSGPSSLSMSVDLHNLVTSNHHQDSGHFSSSPEITGTKLQCPSQEEEESYEAFGSVEGDPDDGIESHAGSSSTPSPTGGPNSFRNPRSPNSTIGRQTWLRTSLRRSQPSSGRKRLSTNALASQLYRSGSFNSLGRSVNGETTDDLYSDVSLEEDVIDLNQKLWLMNAQNPVCQFGARPLTSTPRQSDHGRIVPGPSVSPLQNHPPSYGYYPTFYPRFNPYDAYASYYYPTVPQQPPCCTEISSRSSSWSRFSAFILIILTLCTLVCAVYRSCRDTRHEIRSRIMSVATPPSQTSGKRLTKENDESAWERRDTAPRTRMESNLDEISNPSTYEYGDRDTRSISGEGPPSSLGAGLEYDLWEGQFQFVGEPTRAADRAPRQNGPRLVNQVQMIQEQMDALVDTQSIGEERYARVKQENATLQARILMLEEAAKDAEARAEERLQAEQRRHREWASRLEREKQLQLENYAIKIQATEMESASLRDEIGRLREQLERVKNDKSRLENDLAEARRETESLRESERQATSRANAAHQMLEVAKDELAARLEEQQKYEDLAQEIAELRTRNKSLEESRDELQAAVALQAGRELLMLNSSNNVEKGPSLAAELLAGMNQDQADGQAAEDSGPVSISELKQTLKEQQEVNTQLRAYIDGILLNIVENYPQLLEVKQTH